MKENVIKVKAEEQHGTDGDESRRVGNKKVQFALSNSELLDMLKRTVQISHDEHDD
jgi:hypothetical protein